MTVTFTKQPNTSGDADLAEQGFGRRAKTDAPLFQHAHQAEDAISFFTEQGYVVLTDCLNDQELEFFNLFYDRTQASHPFLWGLTDKRKPHHRTQGLIYSQPLLDHPELDSFIQHPASFPIAEALLGGPGNARFSEFNLRETPQNAGHGAMNFHHDAVSPDRLDRSPYMPCDWVCAIHYLTDVSPETPAFCVVPGSNRYATLHEAFTEQASAYVEQPIYGPAGTCVLYDTALFHTRLDGDGVKSRRTWHQYYARGGWLRSALPTTDRYMRPPSPPLTDWNLFPKRLALHPDPAIRLFFSHWNTAMCEWVASDFDDAVRAAMPRGHQ